MTLSVSVLGTDGNAGGGNGGAAHSSSVNTSPSSSAAATPERNRQRKVGLGTKRPPAISLQLAEDDSEETRTAEEGEEEEEEENDNMLKGSAKGRCSRSLRTPSRKEQELVLGGSYGALISGSQSGAVTPTTPTLLMGEGSDGLGMLQEAARAMADWADAPRQEVDESKL